MRQYFIQLFSLFDRAGKIRIGGLFVLIVFATLLEMCGLGLIFPLMEGLKNPDSIINLPILKYFYQTFYPGDSNGFLLAVSVAVGLVFVFKNLVLMALVYLQNRFTQNRIAQMCQKLLEGYLELPYAFHLQRNLAELLRNIQDSVMTVFKSGLLSILFVVLDGLIAIGLLGVLMVVDPVSTLIVSAVLGSGLFLFYWGLRNYQSRWGEIDHILLADIYKWINQTIGAVKEVKVLGREKFFADQFSFAVFERAKSLIATGTAKQSPRLIFEILVVAAMFLVFWSTLAQGKTVDSALTVLAMFAVASFRLLPSINRIAASAMSIRSTGAVLNDLYKDYQLILKTRQELPVGSLEPVTFEKDIHIEGVSFSYPEAHKQVLSGVDFRIFNGEMIGIVGPSGAGKTTLVDVFLGLHSLKTGRLLVDGRDVRENIRGWQKKIGYVPQKIYLMDDTLRRNIAFGIREEEIDEERVGDAIRFASLDAFVAGLPEGVNTVVGDRGARLSGGQSQRIGIARALYHDPQILVFDEATSSLDSETEHEISESIRKISRSKTTIIIAHRLSTVRQCDRLVYMKDGTVVDIDGFDGLIARNPDFRRQVELGTFAGKV